jgi:hypothetical protein
MVDVEMTAYEQVMPVEIIHCNSNHLQLPVPTPQGLFTTDSPKSVLMAAEDAWIAWLIWDRKYAQW